MIPKKIVVFAVLLIFINMVILMLEFSPSSVAQITGQQISGDSGTVIICLSADPLISSIPNNTLVVDQSFFFDVNATNECGETHTFSDSTTTFDIDPNSGVISFTANFSHVGVEQIFIFVNENGVITNTSFTLTVEGLDAPTLEGKRNADEISVDLNWTNVSVADSYNLYYSSNITHIYPLNISVLPSSVTKITNLTSLNYTDSTADQVQKRYYRVSSVKNGTEKLSNTVGKFTFYYDVLNSSVYGPLASNQVAIYLNKSYSAEVFLQEIPGGLNPTMSRLDKSDGGGEFLTTHVRGLSDGNNFTLEKEIGYRVTVDDYYNHTIVGGVFPPSLQLEYDLLNSSVFGPLATNWRGIYDFNKSYSAEVFLQEIPGGLNPTMSRLDKSDGGGEFLTTHVRGLSDGNDFDLLVGVGYIITVDNDYNHTLCTGVQCYGGSS